MSDRVSELLQRCGTDEPVLPPTELYNEGWMLRLVLDWFENRSNVDHPLSFQPDARWYSEALLASRFLPTRRGDPLAESFTHADGVIGHFDIRPGERGEATVTPDARQLIVIEAKMGSGLSKGVKNSPGYGQAARNVACIAHALEVAGARPEQFDSLGFFVVAPKSQIEAGVFRDLVTADRIRSQVATRVEQYDGRHGDWFEEHFVPTLEVMKLGLVSWEELVDFIDGEEGDIGLRDFYDRCLRFNPLRARK